MSLKYLVFLFLTLLPGRAFLQPNLTIEQIMQGPAFVGELPGTPYWSYDNSTIYFQWNQDSLPDDEIYRYSLDLDSLNRLTLEEHKMLPPAGGSHNQDRSKRAYQQQGDLFLQDMHTGAIIQITNTVERESTPVFTWDQESILFHSGENLFTWSLIDGTIDQLTQFKKGAKKGEEKLTQQQSWLERDQLEYFEILKKRQDDKDFAENQQKLLEASRPKEIYLGKDDLANVAVSPDLRFVIYQIRKPADGKSTIVPDYVTQNGFVRDLSARTKVGDEQSTYTSFIYDRQKDTIVKIETEQIPGIYDKPDFLKEYYQGAEPYVDTFSKAREVIIHGPIFNEGGTQAVVDIRSSDNKDRWIMSLIPADGTLHLIDHQHDDAWIGGPGINGWNSNMGNLGFLADGETLWYQSEKSGYSHIYLYNFKNKETATLTSGKFEILNAKLSHDKTFFYITANKENPFENHFYHFKIATASWQKITGRPGGYQVTVSPDESKLAILYSYSNQPTELYWMENQSGAALQKITESTTSEFNDYPWRDPEIIKFKARDGVMVPARIYEPEVEDKNGAAIVFVHGAGYLHNVHKWWSTYYREYMFHNFLADLGYTIIDIDYRGSAGYGRDWRTAIYRFMGGKDLDDQVDGANYLVEHKRIDKGRIGIYGGSYGGFITLMALCTSPGTFKCGAALRSVTDWAHYNHGYTSNILNTPVQDSLAYYRSSPIYHAEGLQGDLLMLHGMVDRNVHFQDVVRMSQRFIELGKDNWELAIFPMEDHGFVESSSWADEYKRIFRLFEKNLSK